VGVALVGAAAGVKVNSANHSAMFLNMTNGYKALVAVNGKQKQRTGDPCLALAEIILSVAALPWKLDFVFILISFVQ
jgi:hypothetical protein